VKSLPYLTEPTVVTSPREKSGVSTGVDTQRTLTSEKEKKGDSLLRKIGRKSTLNINFQTGRRIMELTIYDSDNISTYRLGQFLGVLSFNGHELRGNFDISLTTAHIEQINVALKSASFDNPITLKLR
jgi:hypothetical protein